MTQRRASCPRQPGCLRPAARRLLALLVLLAGCVGPAWAGEQSLLEAWESRARAGDAYAAYVVARMHLDGRGAPRDPEAAARWLEQAAGAGLGKAQLGLAELYEQGIGVPRDEERAVRLYRAAASQGLEEARQALARLGVVAKAGETRGMAGGSGEAPAGEAAASGRDGPPEEPATAVASTASEAEALSSAGRSREGRATPARSYIVQLAALSSREAAERERERLGGRFPELLAGLDLRVLRAALSQQRTYYRLRTARMADYRAARTLCSRLKAREQDCLVVELPRAEERSRRQ